jgi:L-threonylcarbamoyladenylate synthase
MKQFTTDQMSAVAAALTDGQVVAVPTETVYGLAVRLDSPEAIARLADIKQHRPGSGKVFTLMLPGVDQIAKFAPLERQARVLAERYFPGQLTLVLPKNPTFAHTYFDNFETIGIRIPDHEFMLDLLKLTGPLLVTSANRLGQPPAADSQTVAQQLPEIDAVVTGESGRQPPSTVAKIENGGESITILRQGGLRLA